MLDRHTSNNPINKLISIVFALALILCSGISRTTSSRSRSVAPVPIVTDDLIRCEPGLGGRIFAGGGDVVVQVLRPFADLTSDIYLFRPGKPPRLIGNSRGFNDPPVLLGHFPAGSELVFGIIVRGTGNTFKTGAGSRNPDGLVHAIVGCLPNGGSEIGFEDFFGGGDNDRNDVRLHVTNKNRRGITEPIGIPDCTEGDPPRDLSPIWGHFNNSKPLRVLQSNAGETLRLKCSPVNDHDASTNSFQLLYSRPGFVGPVDGAIRIGLCPFHCGSNSPMFMYSGDADGDGKPDRFIMTYWKSRDYGANDNPNNWTHQPENSPVLDHAISYYEMETDNYIKADDKYAYAFQPTTEDFCPAAREGAFLGRQLVPRDPNIENFKFVFAHYRRLQASFATHHEDPYSLADFNRDGVLNESDSQIFQNTYANCIGDSDFVPAADFDGDGCVTWFDKEIWLDLFTGSMGNHAPRAIVKSIEVPADSSCSASIRASDVNDGSFDPDGDNITFALDSTGPFDLGDHLVTLTVTDTHGASSSFSTIVTVVPINIGNISVSKSELWPPNHKMVDVTVSYDAINNCGTGGANCVLSVSSNEPINGTGDGDTSPDWEIINAHHVRLRSERSGNGGGRIYTITITCTDGVGNSSAKSVTVTVPKSQAGG